MPLPMVHLAVAMEMHKILRVDPRCAFLLGSIAPDAIHMRPGTGPTDKQRVHLFDGGDPDHQRVRALLQQFGAYQGADLGFSAGYAAHVLTDRFWEETIGGPFRASFPGDIDPQVRRTLYYQETDQIDFDLYHQAPWRDAVWEKLASCQPQDFAGLVSADEITRWRDRNLTWFGTLKQEPSIIPTHITRIQIEAFILQAAPRIMEKFREWGFLSTNRAFA
jgi:hypothetical protein